MHQGYLRSAELLYPVLKYETKSLQQKTEYKIGASVQFLNGDEDKFKFTYCTKNRLYPAWGI
jgi:hypothetical protein